MIPRHAEAAHWTSQPLSNQTKRMLRTQVAGILGGSAELTGRALDSDCLVEPVRGPLIPGFAAVKKAARAEGAAHAAAHSVDMHCTPGGPLL